MIESIHDLHALEEEYWDIVELVDDNRNAGDYQAAEYFERQLDRIAREIDRAKKEFGII